MIQRNEVEDTGRAVALGSESPRNLLGKATRIAAAAHESQVDKAGDAYILHPLRMMARARTEDERIVALLHDVVEDSGQDGGPRWGLEDLAQEGFPAHIVDAVDCLTGREGEDYGGFITRVLTNPLAARVKRLDIEDNMDLTRLGTLSGKDLARLQKYHVARRRLLEAEAARDE